MIVMITNNTEYNQYVDIKGKDNPYDIKVFGPKSRVRVSIPSNADLIRLSKEFGHKLTIRKI